MDESIVSGSIVKQCHETPKTKRTGWVRCSVKFPESISDHMYLMSIIAWLAAPCAGNMALNKEKCIKMALVHDITESIVGDITPHDNISKEEKHALERAAMEQICEISGQNETIANEFVNLWNEYEDGITLEAQMVKQVDKFEMALQAYIYEQDQHIDLEDFFNSAKKSITDPLLASWMEELLRLRVEFWSEHTANS